MTKPNSIVGIIDLGVSNIASLAYAVERAGHAFKFVRIAPDVEGITHLILPGVGSFSRASRALRDRGLVEEVQNHVCEGYPLLGICLGMQLLAASGDEHGPSLGLGLVEGSVIRIRTEPSELRLPHVGWNDIDISKPSGLLEGVKSGESFYFVHSYVYSDPQSKMVVATVDYGGPQVAVVQNRNVYGVQFHPEKSQASGARVLSNFLSI